MHILGDGYFEMGSASYRMRIAHHDLLAATVAGGNNEDSINYHHYHTAATSLINRALGMIEGELWPPKEPNPILIINDEELRGRCSDLLGAPGKFDRVIREATTILENRIRTRVPHEVLSRLIPLSKEQSGENLVNHIFAPKAPVLVFSNDEHERLAFFKMLLGVFAYLRNPHHHKLDNKTEWSWAWSTVGLIDRLLADVESCEIIDQ